MSAYFKPTDWPKERITWIAGRIGGHYDKDNEIHKLIMGFYIGCFGRFVKGNFVFSKNVGLDQKFFLHVSLLRGFKAVDLALPPVNMSTSGKTYQAEKQKKIASYKNPQ